MDQIVVYLRMVLYLLCSLVLLLFCVLHRDRSRKVKSLALSVFFLTVVASLIARLTSGTASQAWVVDWITTPALVFYACALCVDFYHAGRNGARDRPPKP